MIKVHSYHSSLVKQWFDLLLSFLGLIIFAPIIILISCAIKLTSYGPVFFVQNRTGYKGSPFKIIMFRTMYKGAELDQKKYAHLNEADGPVFKIKDDPRNIKIQFLLGLPLGNLQSLL